MQQSTEFSKGHDCEKARSARSGLWQQVIFLRNGQIALNKAGRSTGNGADLCYFSYFLFYSNHHKNQVYGSNSSRSWGHNISGLSGSNMVVSKYGWWSTLQVRCLSHEGDVWENARIHFTAYGLNIVLFSAAGKKCWAPVEIGHLHPLHLSARANEVNGQK